MTSLPIDAVLVGAGARGTFTYGEIALNNPDTLRFVAVAEPDPERRAGFARDHGIPDSHCFATWEEFLGSGQSAQALVCTTLDRLHVAPAVAALEAGYHVLLEKPMAIIAEDCVRIAHAAESAGRVLILGHVLRYTEFFTRMHDIVSSGRLGDIVSIEHRENVAFSHMAHSYVRGNWNNSERASPMILSKCSHDFDLLTWMMHGNPVRRLHSFGSLMHFRSECAPAGTPERCTDGCPAAESCLFYAPRQYLTEDVGWPTETISVDLSHASRLRALQTGPYGRCVYRAENDVVDHQVVTMEHNDGATVTLIMQGHSDREERTMRIDGTRATLRARFQVSGVSEMTVHDHLTDAEERIAVDAGQHSGHGGGDAGLIRAFVEAVRSGGDTSPISARMSLESHLLAFAAERSRVTGEMIDMPTFRAEVEDRASNQWTLRGDHHIARD